MINTVILGSGLSGLLAAKALVGNDFYDFEILSKEKKKTESKRGRN